MTMPAKAAWNSSFSDQEGSDRVEPIAVHTPSMWSRNMVSIVPWGSWISDKAAIHHMTLSPVGTYDFRPIPYIAMNTPGLFMSMDSNGKLNAGYADDEEIRSDYAELCCSCPRL